MDSQVLALLDDDLPALRLNHENALARMEQSEVGLPVSLPIASHCLPLDVVEDMPVVVQLGQLGKNTTFGVVLGLTVLGEDPRHMVLSTPTIGQRPVEWWGTAARGVVGIWV